MKGRQIGSRQFTAQFTAVLGLLVLLLGSHSVTYSSQGAVAQANKLEHMTFRTVATFATRVSASLAKTATLVGAGGDWVAYTLSYYACGHCGFVATQIGVHNDYSKTDKVIRGAVDSSRGDPISIDFVQFVMPYVVWRQPSRPAGQGDNFTPGEFDCTLCYYDVRTGQGGQILDLADLGVQADSPLTASPIALDRQGSGRVLMWVHADKPSGGKLDGQIWIVDIKTGEKRAPFGSDMQAVIYEMALSGDMAAWIQDPTETSQDIYVYKVGDSAPRKVSVSGKLTQIKTNGTSLFAWKNDNTKALANGGEVVQINPDTGATTSVPNSSSTYDVYGTRVAWFNNAQPAVYDLRDKSVITSDPITAVPYNPEVVNHIMTVKLDEDQFTLSALTLGGIGTIHDHTIRQAWLVAPDPVFGRVWAKSDQPVLRGAAKRSWLWGIRGQYHGWERYDQAPGGRREVQYFDKARMEINNPQGNPNDPYYVTNGLLTVEMIGGEISFGDEMQIKASVLATIPVAGDPRKDNPLTPGYSALRGVASIHGENQAPKRIGQFVNEAMDVNGVVSLEKTNARTSKYVAYVPETGHNIPDVFQAYLQDMKATYGYDWTFALGYPITEAYWTKMKVQFQEYPVMIQAYQRRVLTYIPAFPEPWKVQQGNVGQHYFEWRYTQNSAINVP